MTDQLELESKSCGVSNQRGKAADNKSARKSEKKCTVFRQHREYSGLLK
jgi:hypothetical protein